MLTAGERPASCYANFWRVGKLAKRFVREEGENNDALYCNELLLMIA